MTTEKQLRGALDVLNCETQLNYSLDFTGVGWNLYHKYDQNGYGSQIAYAPSKPEMFNLIHAIRTLLLMEHQNKQTEYEKQTKLSLKAKGYYIQVKP